MSSPVDRAWSIEDLRRIARRRLPRAVFDFIDGGAETESTLRANRAAFERARFLPKVLVNVAQVDTSTTILGGPSKLPIAIAPTGAVGFGRRGGDIAIARTAAAFGIPYTLSTTATTSIEQIAREAPGRLWFQVYVFKRRDFTLGLIERARAADYEAIVVTVDLAVGGKRERDMRNDFSIPFRFTRPQRARFRRPPGMGDRDGRPRHAGDGEPDRLRERGGQQRRDRGVGRPQHGRLVRLGRAEGDPRPVAAQARRERDRTRRRHRAAGCDGLRRGHRLEPRRAAARRRGRDARRAAGGGARGPRPHERAHRRRRAARRGRGEGGRPRRGSGDDRARRRCSARARAASRAPCGRWRSCATSWCGRCSSAACRGSGRSDPI